MAVKNPYKQPYKVAVAASCLLGSLCGSPLPAYGADQTQAQLDARRLNNQGSDDSLDASYGNALQALNHFYNLNIPGAISKGVKAYGQYRNSEKLDDLKDTNGVNANSMSSVGAGRPEASGITGHSQYVSPYARLDKKFLYQGETGKIAEKIEKLSGIKREKMFQMAVDLHTNSKSLDDPDFIPWGMTKYRELVKAIPNDDFRSALNKFGDLADGVINTGAVKSVLAQFRKVDKEAPATMLAEAKDQKAPTTETEAPLAELAQAPTEATPAPTEATPAAIPATPRTDDPTSSFDPRGVMAERAPNQRPGFERIQLDPRDKFFDRLAQEASANVAEQEETIFRMVSRKIKDVSDRQYLYQINVAGGM